MQTWWECVCVKWSWEASFKLIEYNASLWLDLEVMFDSMNDKKTSYSKMFLQQSNLFICQKSCKVLRAKINALSSELELLVKNSTVTKTEEKKRYIISYEQWSDHADWNSKFLFYRKIRFCISDLIRLTPKFHDDVHHRIFEILHTFAEHASRRFHSTEFSSSSKRDSTSKISCSTTRAHFLSTRMNFEQLWNVSQWW